MNHTDAYIGMRVAYVPVHADGDLLHPDVEYGTVSSCGSQLIYVRFDEQMEKHGFEGATAKGCKAANLFSQEKGQP